MSYVADSNILTALSQKKSSQYIYVEQAIAEFRQKKENIVIFPQNLVEFWAVATRPLEANGLNLSIEKTVSEMRRFRRNFTFVNELPDLFFEWEILVQKYQVKGKNVHDARIVAAMMQHGITHLLTFNVKDFNRFDEITVVDPKEFV
ncbi:MAG: type II toxin-antitoxin system VapC family toxin [Pyrinomonadaceae bacterium]